MALLAVHDTVVSIRALVALEVNVNARVCSRAPSTRIARNARARLARGSNVALFRIIRARVSNTLAAANNVNVNALLHARTPATIDRAGHAGVAILSLLAEFLARHGASQASAVVNVGTYWQSSVNAPVA